VRSRAAGEHLAATLLPFVQLEFPGRVGLDDGRYLTRRDGEASEVVVVATLGAPPAGRRRRRRRAAAVSDDPGVAALPLTRVTVVTPNELGGAREAQRWLRDLTRDEDAAAAQVEAALLLVNRALAAQRAGSQDPYVHELSAEHAVALRIGYGSGDEVADGEWSDAREIRAPERRRRRAEALQPQERVAAVLGGREVVLACETLLLRARLDLDQHRAREAALQLRVGLEALLGELSDEPGPGVREDLAALESSRDAVVEAANEALRGELDEARIATLRDALARCERALRRRRVGA
jgi:hypothetical protein